MRNLREYVGPEVTLVTHNGVCHSDDMLSAALLSLYFEARNIRVNLIRTRDAAEVPESKETIMFDVFGGELDHHQKETVEDGGRPLASIGLVWRWGKEEFIRVFNLDELTWSEIDSQLFKAVDLTDNSGLMNPFNWVHNCIRNAQGWEEVLEWDKKVLQNILAAMAEKAKQQREYLQCEVKEISGIKCRYSSKFLPSGVEADKAVKAFVWKNEKGHIMIKAMNGLKLKAGLTSGEVEGVIFTHKGGWIGEVETTKDIEKIIL